MIFRKTTVEGAWLVEPEPRHDSRGRFMRAWCKQEFLDHGVDFTPLQANMAYSASRGTIRGMHYQVAPALEAKLVRCTRGALFDVVVDLRPASSTYLRWHGIALSAEDGRMLFIPEGCAHGCLSLEDSTEVLYMTSAVYAPDHARGIRFDDPAIGVQWPAVVEIVSDQDRNWPLLNT